MILLKVDSQFKGASVLVRLHLPSLIRVKSHMTVLLSFSHFLHNVYIYNSHTQTHIIANLSGRIVLFVCLRDGQQLILIYIQVPIHLQPAHTHLQTALSRRPQQSAHECTLPSLSVLVRIKGHQPSG